MAELAAEPADPARRTAVLEHLLTGRLLAALGKPAAGVEPVEGVEPDQLHLLAIPRDDAQPTVLCFTDDEAFGRLLPPGPRAVVPLPALWAWLAELGLPSATVNAGGPVAVTLHAAELAALAEGRLPEPGEGGPEARDVLFAPPAPVPPGLDAAVTAAAEPHPEVLAAYVLEAATDGQRRLVAALRLTPGLPDERATGVVAGIAAELAAAGASAVATTPWEAELIAASHLRPAFERPLEPPRPTPPSSRA